MYISLVHGHDYDVKSKLADKICIKDANLGQDIRLGFKVQKSP